MPLSKSSQPLNLHSFDSIRICREQGSAAKHGYSIGSWEPSQVLVFGIDNVDKVLYTDKHDKANY